MSELTREQIKEIYIKVEGECDSVPTEQLRKWRDMALRSSEREAVISPPVETGGERPAKLRITELLRDEDWHQLSAGEQNQRRKDAANAIEACFEANDLLLKARALATAQLQGREVVEREIIEQCARVCDALAKEGGARYEADSFIDGFQEGATYSAKAIRALSPGQAVSAGEDGRPHGHSALHVRNGQIEQFDPHPAAPSSSREADRGMPEEPKVYSVSFHPNMDYDDVVLKSDYDKLRAYALRQAAPNYEG